MSRNGIRETFLPGDSRSRRSRGLAAQDDRHAVDHSAVGGSGCDVWRNTYVETKTYGE